MVKRHGFMQDVPSLILMNSPSQHFHTDRTGWTVSGSSSSPDAIHTPSSQIPAAASHRSYDRRRSWTVEAEDHHVEVRRRRLAACHRRRHHASVHLHVVASALHHASASSVDHTCHRSQDPTAIHRDLVITVIYTQRGHSFASSIYRLFHFRVINLTADHCTLCVIRNKKCNKPSLMLCLHDMLLSLERNSFVSKADFYGVKSVRFQCTDKPYLTMWNQHVEKRLRKSQPPLQKLSFFPRKILGLSYYIYQH